MIAGLGPQQTADARKLGRLEANPHPPLPGTPFRRDTSTQRTPEYSSFSHGSIRSRRLPHPPLQVLSSRVSEPSPTCVHTHAHTCTYKHTYRCMHTHLFSSDPFLIHIHLMNNLIFLRQLKSISDPQSGFLKC